MTADLAARKKPKTRTVTASCREWGVIIVQARDSDPEPPRILGWTWFDMTPLPSGVSNSPARFKTRREAREAVAAKYSTGYFAGRMRVVRLWAIFTVEAPCA